MIDLEELKERALSRVANTTDRAKLEEIRIVLLGRGGEITNLLKGMRELLPADRPTFGAKVNELKEAVTAAVNERLAVLEEAERESRIAEESLDVTLCGAPLPEGAMHPLTSVYYEIRDIFLNMGYDVMEGPEIELEKYNFDMLNIPPDHPARDEQDTFYIEDGIVLRTHTSPVQVRTMLQQQPPIRMICPGRVFRSDDVDATHSPVFNQIEGLVIDKGICFADLKGTLDTFLKTLYGESTKLRFRPGFFPFTEPSAEVDATCVMCGGKGCPACHNAGVIELLGCGMVHSNVLRNCGIDPEVYSGFAFGMGLDRLANIKYGISDIRLLYENDVRFLRQFK